MSDSASQAPLSLLQWPESVQTCSLRELGRFAKLTGLPDRLRRAAWSDINQNAPALAELLKDPLLKEAMQMFDADLYVEAGIVPSLPPEWLPGKSG